MSLIVSEVYDALIEAGSSPEKARAAAAAVPAAENMATREDIAKLESRMATKEDLGGVKQDIARLETATKDEFARLDKKIGILNFAVFSFGPTIVAMLAKLIFFP